MTLRMVERIHWGVVIRVIFVCVGGRKRQVASFFKVFFSREQRVSPQ
jgi:hypothetical protein